MTETRGDRRAETAKLNDDSDVIDQAREEALGGQAFAGSSGGNLQRDIGTQADQERVSDPDAHESLTKGDQDAHGERGNQPKPGDSTVGG